MKTAKRVLCAALGAVQLAGSMAFGVTASAAEAAKPDTNTIAAGSNHSLVIKSDMSLWVAGDNSMGQLGLGSDVTDSDGKKLLNNIIFAEANDDSSFAIDTSGTLYGWGDNSKGQISPSTSDMKIFKPMKLMENVLSVSAGDTHTVAVTADGAAYGWGSNAHGELGFAINSKKNAVLKLKDNIVDTAAGDSFTLLVTSDGKLYSSGSNDNGQLGIGSRRDYEYFSEVPVSGVAQADAGNDHSLLLMSNGTVMTAGLNTDGQITGTRAYNISFTTIGVSGVEAVFAGGNSSAAVTSASKLYVWGCNSNGQLQNKKTDNITTPATFTTGVISVAFGENHSLVLKSNGNVDTVGEGTYGQLFDYSDSVSTKPERILKDIEVYSAGIDHAAAIDNKGNLYTWGSNDRGQLGLGDFANRSKPEKVSISNAKNVWCGDKTTIVITTDNRVVVFGDNSDNLLGMETDDVSICTPKTNFYLSDYSIEDIQFGKGFAIALIDGMIYGWGRNPSGQLGDWQKVQTDPVPVFDNFGGVTKIAVGDYHCAAIDSSGEIYVWGSNASKILGGDFEETRLDEPEKITLTDKKDNTYTAMDIAAAANYTMALGSNDRVWVWGINDCGQLASNEKKFTQPYMLIDTADKIAAGRYTSAVIDLGQKLYLVGSNKYGALGDGKTADKTVYVGNTGSEVIDVDIGDYFGGYIRDDGALYCWGDNSLGQVGNGKGGVSVAPAANVSGALCKPLAGAKSIALDKTELIIKPNTTATLKATLTPANTAVKLIRWSSSDTKVAIVSSTGVVKGIKNGTAVITAETANGVSASCTVTVTVPVSSFSVSPKTSKTLKIGGTFTFKTKIYPSNAVDKTLIYESSDPDVATVSEKGKVKAISAGKATITVTAKSNPEKTRTVTVYVKPAKMKFSSRKATADGVVLKWKENEAVDGYAIYRRTSKDGKEKLLANVEDAASFIDDTAKKGNTYYYTIKAYVEADGKKIYSASSAVYKVKAK